MYDNDLIIVEVPDATTNGTNSYVIGTGLTAGVTAVLELDGLAIAKLSVPVFVVSVEKASLVDIIAELQLSVDGSAYRRVATVTVPIGGKGQFSAPIGGFEAMFRRTAANVQCRASFPTSAATASDWDRMMAAITDGEPTIGGKKPDDTLLA